MQIVNFQCGKCGRLMGVSAEHLGTQVHCPHCHEIVETPPPAPAADAFAEVHVEVPDIKEQESIFTNPEDEHGEDLFGGPAKPLVELPPESAPQHAVHHEQRPFSERHSRRADSFAEPRAAAAPPETFESPADEEAQEAPAASAPSASTAPKTSKSLLGPTLLVLLIPYSLLTTVYIVWSLFNTRDAFENMRDTGKDGAPRRVNPDRPLPAKLKTSLRQAIRVGELEIYPLKVEINREGDLVLLLKLSNMSTDQAFSPIDHSFLHFAESSRKTPRPYSYLDAGEQGKLQGGYLRFLKQPTDRNEDPGNGLIRPGQEVYAEITTLDKYRDAKVKLAMQSSRPLIWRVHCRRGFVVIGGRDVSATAVIGVEFAPSAIDKAKA